MHLEDVAERYTLLLEGYLRGAGGIRKELLKQNAVTNKLVQVALKIKEVGTSERKEILLDNLAKLKLPSRFQLPLDQRYALSTQSKICLTSLGLTIALAVTEWRYHPCEWLNVNIWTRKSCLFG
jgi:hypothetical protein